MVAGVPGLPALRHQHIFGTNDVALGENHGFLDGMLQLADVSRPVIAAKFLNRLFVHTQLLPPVSWRHTCAERHR